VSASAPRPRSGEQSELTSGPYRAVIASVGATLRVLEHAGRPLVRPFDADEVRPKFRGATLAPWPNRVVDGRWRDAGRTSADGGDTEGDVQQLPITEPERGHALHGLAAWLDFAVVERDAARVVLAARIEPQPGYPFPLELRVAFTLSADGLDWSVEATNRATRPAPFGAAPHPYLVAPDGRVDDWTLELAADRMLEVDDRLAPVGVVDVPEAYDFRTPRTVGDLFIDHAFTGLARDGDGTAVARVTDAAGRGAQIAFDSRSGWVQVHTADLPDAEASRRGLAVEPMTCPPDAFNSGTDLIVIEPGGTASVSWRISAIG
jgi:aldose 1-epimerase